MRPRLLPMLMLGTAMLPVPAAWAAPEPVLPLTVRQGDTLWGLSNEALTGPAAWREVARRNRLPDANRIRPGQVLQVPQRLLRVRPVEARLVLVQGEVELAGRPAVAGEPVSAGQLLRTGAGASAVVELHDGSRLRVQPATEAALAESARLGARTAPQGSGGASEEGWFAGSMRLVRGSLEVVAARLLRAKPLEVQSPTAVIGVRGTEYRVHHGTDQGTRTEVL
ncbi:MAG: FecR domain-containing protein, partial [Aquincola tertiaricarbonis]